MPDVPHQPSRRQRRMPRGVPFFAIIAVAFIAFLAGGAGSSYQGKLGEVQKNDNASYLPASAESTKVSDELAQFIKVETVPGFLVFHRDSGLTTADKAAVGAALGAVKNVPGVDRDAITAPQYSADGTTGSIFAPLVAKDNGASVAGDKLATAEKDALAAAKQGLPEGLAVHPAGPGGLLVAFIDAFGGLDGVLLGSAFGLVILILLVVYRSPVLWFFPLFSAVLALGLSSMIIYFLAKNAVLTLTGQSQGILSVLVLGAGTDYALLLIS
ncbi:MAG: MMPL family transporter, partial [Mycobacteriaceae bacterium]